MVECLEESFLILLVASVRSRTVKIEACRGKSHQEPQHMTSLNEPESRLPQTEQNPKQGVNTLIQNKDLMILPAAYAISVGTEFHESADCEMACIFDAGPGYFTRTARSS